MCEGVEITVPEFAKLQGVNEKSLRAKLRRAFPQHEHGVRWIVRQDSPDYAQWLKLAAEIHAWWEADSRSRLHALAPSNHGVP